MRSKKKGLNKTLYLLLVNLLILFLGIGLVNSVMPTLKHEMNINGQIMGYIVFFINLASFSKHIILPYIIISI